MKSEKRRAEQRKHIFPVVYEFFFHIFLERMLGIIILFGVFASQSFSFYNKCSRVTFRYPLQIDSKNFNDIFEDNLEQVFDKELQIQGRIPPFLYGRTLLRNGPSLFSTLERTERTKRTYTHIFDGLARLTRFHFTLAIYYTIV